MLGEFAAMVGCHRKHAVRLLRQDDKPTGQTVPRGQRVYDEALREALTVVWEASDRICGKRLKAALPGMVESPERHGHLDLAVYGGLQARRPDSSGGRGARCRKAQHRDITITCQRHRNRAY